MATQVREGHFQACKLLTPMAEMVSWYQTLDSRSPEHRSLFYSWVPDRAPSGVPQPPASVLTWPLAQSCFVPR